MSPAIGKNEGVKTREGRAYYVACHLAYPIEKLEEKRALCYAAADVRPPSGQGWCVFHAIWQLSATTHPCWCAPCQKANGGK